MDMLTETILESPRVSVESFCNPQHQTRYRILVDGIVTDDLGGIGWRSPEKALNYWDSKHGLSIKAVERKAERRAAYLAAEAKRKEKAAAFEAATEEAKKKILVLLDQRPVWNTEEMQSVLEVTDTNILSCSPSFASSGIQQ
jgi:hypothetical protein